MSDYKIHRIRFVDYKPKAINATAFDHNGKDPKLALAREDGSIEIRNPKADWSVDYTIPGHEKRTVEQLVWCDGRLFSGSVSSDIIEWDLDLLQPKYHQDSYGGPVWCLRFSYSKKILAVGCEDGGIHLFDVFTDSLMYKGCLNKQEHRILCLAWTHDDEYIITGGFNCMMNKCSVKSGHIISRMTTNNLKSGNTMVWSMEILKDMTIVIGDSLGNTQFWDGEICTMLQTFKSHMADVLSVVVSSNEEIVYSTGIDSKVIEFRLVNNSQSNKWVMTKSARATNHDTRTLCLCNEPYNTLISGGIDPRLCTYPVDNFDSHTFSRHPCLPTKDICQLARSANLLLFREQKSLHIWLLSDETSDIVDTRNQPSKKLFQINSDRADHLISSAISHDGRYVAHSTILKGKLFELDLAMPSVQKCAINVPASTHMCFLQDTEHLVTVGHEKNIKVTNIHDGHINTISFPTNTTVHLPYSFLCCSSNDTYACVGDLNSNVFLFSLERNEFITVLPKVENVITSCLFAPNTNNIFFITRSKQIYEYNVEKEKFELWCFEVNKSNIIPLMGKQIGTAKIVVNPQAPTEIFVQEKEVFGKIIHGCHIPTGDEDKTNKEKRKRRAETLRTNRHYSSMMFFDFNASGEIVLVERLMDKILEGLPAPLKIKHYGS